MRAGHVPKFKIVETTGHGSSLRKFGCPLSSGSHVARKRLDIAAEAVAGEMLIAVRQPPFQVKNRRSGLALGMSGPSQKDTQQQAGALVMN